MKKNRLREITIETIRDAIQRRGSFRFSVKGVSMFPFLLDGDEVIIERADPEDLRIGDVVMYVRKELMIVHRIIKIYTTGEGEIGGKATRVIRGNLEFSAPSLHPLIISAARFILNQGRRIKSILNLGITQKDIIEYLKRRGI